MKPLARITAAVLALTVAAAPVSAAKPVPQQPYSEAEMNLLLRAVKQTGHFVLTEASGPGAAQACETGGMLGAANTSRQLLLCVRNHKGDNAELASTLRHEAWHLVTYCIARNEGRTDIHPVFPEDAAQNIAYARDVLRMPMNRYDRESWAAEAEARVMEHALDEAEVASMLRKHCSKL